MKPGPRLATSPPLHSEPGYATQFGSVDGETDGEADRVSVREPVQLSVPLRDSDVLPVIDRDLDAETEDDRVVEPNKEEERLGLGVALDGMLALRVTLAVVDGDTEALASHWQHVCLDAPQLSSATAPLTNALGARTPMQAPAPVGAAWPAAGVPHQLAFVA